MTRLSVGCAVCAVGALLVAGSNANAQQNMGLNGAAEQQVQAADNAAIAASIVSREEAASGRAFEAAFRAEAVRKLASRSLAELEAIQSQDGGLGTNALGDTQADLVFTPITPCRIIDTRAAGGPIAAATTRDFRVTGSGFAGQGGVAGSCGVPNGPATAVVLNIVAVAPAGAGDLRLTPFGTAVPTASIINYALPGSGLNVANGLVAPICNPATTTCTGDFTIMADGSAVQVVADVMGYFAAPVATALDCTNVTLAGTGTGNVANNTEFDFSSAAACAAGYAAVSIACEYAGASPAGLALTQVGAPGSLFYACIWRNQTGGALSGSTFNTHTRCCRVPGR